LFSSVFSSVSSSVLVSALASLLVAGCGRDAPAAAPAFPPPAVEIATVALREVSPASELTGRVEAVHSVELRPRVSGYVTSIDYREGAEVAAGDRLFTIDPRPYRAALDHAVAGLSSARAWALVTRDEAARSEKLVASSIITVAQRDLDVSTAAQAAAAVQAAQAQVALAKLDLSLTQVRAPLPGRTGQAQVSVGDYVAAGPAPTLLTTLVSADPVYVTFSSDEQTFLRFASRALGTPVAVGLADENGYPHPGKIDFIDNRVDAATGTVRLRAVVPNPDKRLTPGLFARVRLGEGAAIQAVVIDDKAVLTDQDRKYVYVLGAGDTVERRDVKLGRIVEGQRVVTEGLKVGERLIVKGLQKVFPGAKATVAPALAQGAGARP
jgi:multidrug efflux system membrane fusion protein